MKSITSVEELKGAIGPLGSSSWFTIDQDRIDAFANATGDHNWIHVDVDRSANGPFGRTIAHGYLTLSLIPLLLKEVFEFTPRTMGLNYGLNRVRFPAPVPVESRIRANVELVSVDDAGDSLQVVVRTSVEVEGQSKPGCVAEAIFRWFT
jgi:acyl dehydratase